MPSRTRFSFIPSGSCWALAAQLVLLCFAVPALAQPTPLSAEMTKELQSLQSQLDEAKAKFSSGDLDGAIAKCDELLELPNRNLDFLKVRAEAYTTQSVAFYKLGQYLKAIDAAYLGTLEQPNNVAAHRARAFAYVARKEFDKAINTCNRVINLDDKDADAYSLRGQAYVNKGNFDQAITDETKALELNGNLADGYQTRATAYVAKNKMPEALKDLQRALEIDPNHPKALCDRATLYALNKDPERAMADLNAAIANDPQSERAQMLKGRCLSAEDKAEEAQACFDKAVELAPNVETYLCRGQFFQWQKKHELAVSDFSNAIAIDDKLLVAYQGRLACNRILGAKEEVALDVLKVRDLSPKPANKDAKELEEQKKAAELEAGRARRFMVVSKPVDPNRIDAIKESAAKIDQMVAKNYVKHRIQPNPLLTDEQFVRRIYLDVTGTIPTYRQLMSFLKSDNPEKRSLLIDALLSSDGYASHFFNYWADSLRYKDELNGNVRGEPFRQYLKQSLAENKPWNKLVYEMLAAQGRIWDTPATGYLQRDPGMPLDVMNNTLRIFLGTRIGCAQCHNHPFDRWTQKDFYQMAAFTFGTQNSTNGGEKKFFSEDPMKRLRKEFASIEQEEEDRRNNSYRFDRMIQMNMMVLHDDPKRSIHLPKDYAYDDAKPEEVILPKTLFGSPAEIKKEEPPRRAFARWLVANDNPRFAKTITNRLWKQVLGRGQFEPVDDIKDNTVAENPELMAFLEAEMIGLNFNMKEYLRILFHTETYQREASTEAILPGQPFHFPGPVLRRFTAEQAWDSFVTLATENNEYREPLATLKAKAIKFNFQTVSAKDVIDSEPCCNQVDHLNNEYRNKFVFRGELIAKASELPAPIPPNHFLRMFGQSDRELISASSTDGSVPQILFMFNGPISHMLLEENSTIYNNIMKRQSMGEGVRTVFLTILSRQPDEEEFIRAVQEVKDKGAAGYGNIVWSLVNTREFLFIQ